MRHLWSLLAGVVIAPLTWCLVALGQNGSQERVGDWVGARSWDTADLIEPAAYLAVAGILLGLIATLRISPVGPLVGGLLLIAPYVGLFIAPLDVRRAVPDNWEVLDRPFPLLVPLDNGTLPLIGALLVMAVFSADRWRRWPSTAAATAGTGAALPATPEPVVVSAGSVGSAGPAEAAAPAGPDTSESPASERVSEPETVPDTGKEPETVSVGAESVAEANGTETGAAARGDSPAESPWSAPPGQSRPEKS
jgi:hypothetical protein